MGSEITLKIKSIKIDVQQILMKSQFTKQKDIKHIFFPWTESLKYASLEIFQKYF